MCHGLLLFSSSPFPPRANRYESSTHAASVLQGIALRTDFLSAQRPGPRHRRRHLEKARRTKEISSIVGHAAGLPWAACADGLVQPLRIHLTALAGREWGCQDARARFRGRLPPEITPGLKSTYPCLRAPWRPLVRSGVGASYARAGQHIQSGRPPLHATRRRRLGACPGNGGGSCK